MLILRFCNGLTRGFPFILVALALLAYATPHQSSHLAAGVPAYIGIVMLAMGLTMGVDDFKAVFSQPGSVVLGVALRYLLMPLVALCVVKLLRLGPALSVGFLLVGCCPSAVASNVMTFLSRGNTALSVTISTCNTLVAPLLTPLLFLFYAGSFIKVDAVGMLLSIAKIVLLPVIAGILIRAVARERIRHVIPFLPAISAISLILIVMAGIALNANRMLAVGAIAFVGVAIHNGVGLALGFLVSRRVFRLAQPDAQAVAFEVGLENTGLAIALVIGHLSPEAAIPAAIFGAWHNVTGSVLARFWAVRQEQRGATAAVPVRASPTSAPTRREPPSVERQGYE